VINYQLAVSII